MILTVCLNPAIDVTYTVTELAAGHSHPVGSVTARAGGKGLNTARVLTQLGECVAVLGFAGGQRGSSLGSELRDVGVNAQLTQIDGQTRQTITVVHQSQATVFNEPGPTIDGTDWENFLRRYRSHLAGATVVTISGSAPPGAPEDAYAQLTTVARAYDVPTVLDAGGQQLLNALPARPSVVAPNSSELAEALGMALTGCRELLAAAEEVVRRTDGAVVLSAGTHGLVAAVGSRRWVAQPPRVLAGNPTGAGDAVTAAVARGIAHRRDWPALLADAVAVAAAAVAAPVAGEINLDTYAELRTLGFAEELACP